MDTSAPQPENEHHQHYYFQGTYVTFLVEDKLFRVPQHTLVLESGFFRSMFSLPQGEGVVEGSSDVAPIKLPPENVKIADFAALLKLLYPTSFPIVSLSGIKEWESILHLATFWEMESVQKLATAELDSLLSSSTYAIKNNLLGKRFENHKWLLRGYEALVRRTDFLTNAEAEEIGWFSAIEVFRLREQYPHKSPTASATKTSCDTCRRYINAQIHFTYYCSHCSCSKSSGVPSLQAPTLPSDAVSKAFLHEFKGYKSYTSSQT